MKASTLLLFTLLLTACGVARPVLESDNTKVEVKVVEKIVKDTAWFELPVIVEKVATLDTASVLENKYSKSEAVVSAGILHHKLETKPVNIPVRVETKTVYRDSLIYRDRIQTKTVVVEKKLTWWQSLKMKAGGFFLILALIAITYIIITLFLKPKLLTL